MSSLNFPQNPEIGDPYLGWVWNGSSWVNKAEAITTADVALTNPQRAGIDTQEDANQYIADALSKLIDEDGNPIGGGDIGNIDGGNASSIYTFSQYIDGGSA